MTPQSLFAWGVIAVTLSIFADIPSTSDLAVAFAYLVLLAVLFNSGAKVFDGITAALGGGTPATTPQSQLRPGLPGSVI